MRIGIITYDFFPFEGGQGRHICEILKRLQNNSDFEITVISPSKNKLKNHVTFFPFTKRIGKNVLFSIFMNVFIYKLIKWHNLDVVHIHGGPGGLFLWRRLNIPVIFTAHHTYYQQYRLIAGQKWKWIFSKLEGLSYKMADKIIAVSNDTKDTLIKNLLIDKENIKIIPNGVDVEKFCPLTGINKIKNSGLYVGRLDERKGIKFLIESMPVIKRKIPDIKLFIVGEGIMRDSLERFIHNNNLTPNVIFLGRVSDKKLVEMYNKVEIVVVPSIFEGFGIVAIEAMACGTPVIGTDVQGIRELIKNKVTGILVPYNNTIELSDSLISLLHNDKMKGILGRNSRYVVLDCFSWDSVSKQLIAIYESFINN